MMNVLKFDFNGSDVEVLTDKDNNYWFFASHICSILGIGNVSQAISYLDEDEKSTITTNDGSIPVRNIISESGMYSLVLKSRKREAKEFKKFITSEVLPSIRRTGSYSVQKALTPAQLILQQAQAMVEIESQINQVKEEVKEIKAKITTTPLDYFAVAGYASYIKYPIDVKEAAALGRQAAKMCKDLGYQTHTMPDPRFGSVKLYPVEILKTIFSQKNLQ